MKTSRAEIYRLNQQIKQLRDQNRSLQNRLEVQTSNYDRLAACFAVVRHFEPLTEISFEILDAIDAEVDYDFQHRKASVRLRKKPF